MMTCRLLCALLVLALCSCPSVCVAEIVDDKEKDVETKQDFDPEHNQMGEPKQVTDQHSTSSSSPEKITVEGTEDARDKAKHTLETTVAVTETTGSQSNLKNTQDDGRSIEEQTENTKTATVNEQNKEYALTMTKTTTTTTKTTTTTTAPETPSSTTTTEAPTTTTTRAHSSLREVDGSLSISAWVCARRCSPYPRWRTPLWAKEVYAGCACQHSTAGICARPL
ncbi:mucin TcMUCII [Trypanosoma cruzi cruzi]|uniref:Putative mucin TcMUCII n=1 Tax=Trypanosoma cruzi TaxID=5693 RepID=A0A2V2VXQ7_TRYCR|nr:mucin TcMUCII [Trypanosoma cruzi cruzi]PWV01051.1 putative mucin TcMUCII [Trypanosoma cruzi]